MLRLRLLATSASTILAMAALAAPTATAQTSPAPATVTTTTTDAPPAPAGGPVEPVWGDIDAFWGDIDAFWGDIDAFEGDVNPFWGDIDAFWGDIDAFWGDIDAFGGGVAPLWGDIDAFWGDIDAFGGGVAPLWGDIDAFWGDIDAFGSDADDSAHQGLKESFNLLVERSASFWGDAVTAQTGKSFWDGFAAGVFEKHGIDLNDPATFNGFSGVDRTRFFFDWYDGLMEFSGRDHADWWMRATNWTPGLTRSAKAGAGTTIGLLDFTVTGSELTDNINSFQLAGIDLVYKGYNNPMLTHGEAVASLIASPHDGRGVMGLAPDAKIAAFNPFDSTGTASWDDIAKGIVTVNLQGASVVNLSLGVPGYALHPDWKALYSRFSVSALKTNTVFVHAAGNEGVTQTANIDWNFATDPVMLVVGSVGPSAQISSFSNTPGTVCLLNKGVCTQQNLLMNRFIVAPGEWILVSDGQGGVTRRSGTSFAAPQVSGALALLQGRWSWLKQKPRETADIILMSARDLGAPGVDPVYGRGLLDITASQSPLNYGKLYQNTTNNKGVVSKTPVTLANPSQAGMLFATSGSTLIAFEDIGTTYRDFSVPLSAILQPAPVAKTTSLVTKTTSKMKTTSKTFADGQVANPFGWDLNMTLAERPVGEYDLDSQLPFASNFSMTSKTGVTMNFGDGLGAQALSRRTELAADRFDPQLGGVNPLLGLASGGAFASLDVPVLGTARLAFGATSRTAEAMYFDPVTGEERYLDNTLAPYKASAAHMLLTQPVSQQLSLNVGYTFLQESDGLLGIQSTNPLAFADGAKTDAATVGLTWAASDRLTFRGSATLGRTRGQSTDAQMLAVHGDGIVTSAFEAAFDVDSVFARGDRARFALVQPMHVERGGLDLTNDEVIDRETGELGSVTRFVGVGGNARRLALETSYATPVFEGQGEVSGFVRAEATTASGARGEVVNMVGGRFSVGF
jgi:hypothetical protein